MPERVSGAARNGCRLRFAKANRECAIVARRRMYVRTTVNCFLNFPSFPVPKSPSPPINHSSPAFLVILKIDPKLSEKKLFTVRLLLLHLVAKSARLLAESSEKDILVHHLVRQKLP